MKRILKYLIVMFTMISLSGCSLATKTDENYHAPWAVGVFLTIDNPVKERVNGVKEGETFVFPGVDGISKFDYYTTLDDSDGIIYDIMGSEIFDQRRICELNADNITYNQSLVLYYEVTKQSKYTVYLNTVYEDNDGNVYVMPADEYAYCEFWFNKDLTTFGANGFRHYAESNRPRNGELRKEIVLNFIEIRGIHKINYYMLYQMDVNNQIISSIKIDPYRPQNEIIKEENIDYFILESHTIFEGEETLAREIINKEDYYIECMIVGDLEFFIPVRIKVK